MTIQKSPHVIFTEVLTKATNHWISLMKGLDFPLSYMDVFNGILLAYGEPHRHYHVLGHIVSMLDEFEEVREFSTNPSAVLLAVWFHDYVYDVDTTMVHGVSNEMRSAQCARTQLKKLGITEDLIKEVCRLILYTDHKQHVYDIDAQIVLDLDLAVLGKEKPVFEEYDAGVRGEYSSVPWVAYVQNRLNVLSCFLSHDPLYYTRYFREKYQEKARANLRRAKAELLKHKK